MMNSFITFIFVLTNPLARRALASRAAFTAKSALHFTEVTVAL